MHPWVLPAGEITFWYPKSHWVLQSLWWKVLKQGKKTSSSGIPASLTHSCWVPAAPTQAGGGCWCQAWTGHWSLCCHRPSSSCSVHFELQLTPGMSHSDIWGYGGQVGQGWGRALGFHSQVYVKPNSTHDWVSSLDWELIWIRATCWSQMTTSVWRGLIGQDVLPGGSRGPGQRLQQQSWVGGEWRCWILPRLVFRFVTVRVCWPLSGSYSCKWTILRYFESPTCMKTTDCHKGFFPQCGKHHSHSPRSKGEAWQERKSV